MAYQNSFKINIQAMTTMENKYLGNDNDGQLGIDAFFTYLPSMVDSIFALSAIYGGFNFLFYLPVVVDSIFVSLPSMIYSICNPASCRPPRFGVVRCLLLAAFLGNKGVKTLKSRLGGRGHCHANPSSSDRIAWTTQGTIPCVRGT